MADPYPARGYWFPGSPTTSQARAALETASAYFRRDDSEMPVVELPDDSALWFDRIDGRCIEFSMSGIDLLRVNTLADIVTSERIILRFLRALIERGAAFAYISAIREEYIWEAYCAIDEAMLDWTPADALPVSIITSSDVVCMWQASLAADMNPSYIWDGVAVLQPAPFRLN
ncbi:MAG: hypothetical protein ACK5KO_03035 [Arachnia sp.]